MRRGMRACGGVLFVGVLIANPELGASRTADLVIAPAQAAAEATADTGTVYIYRYKQFVGMA